jgi:hypothetical protein
MEPLTGQFYFIRPSTMAIVIYIKEFWLWPRAQYSKNKWSVQNNLFIFQCERHHDTSSFTLEFTFPHLLLQMMQI